MDESASGRAGPAAPPRVIGLTGGIASGKSTVGKMLRALGAVVVDADEIARGVVEPGRPAYQRLVAAFGEAILKDEPPAARSAALRPSPGTEEPVALRPLDREKLAARVFADPTARALLNRITHPEIAAESGRRIAAAVIAGAPLIVYEVPLLVENNLHHGLDGLVVVDVPEQLQVERAVQRGLSAEQARARMAAQIARADRLRVANWVIDNSGDEAATQAQVAAAWPALRAGPTPPPRNPL